MSFVVVYSLILASVFTISIFIGSCTYCLTSCYGLIDDDKDEPMPECVAHMYS